MGLVTKLEDYAEKYEHVRFERHDRILQMSLHTNGGPILTGPLTHGEIPAAFADVSNDLDNDCVILTGTGDAFWPGVEEGAIGSAGHPLPVENWYRIVKEGTRMELGFLDIEVPVIAAVNGPCSRHTELIVMSDIVLASPNTVLQDAPHFWNGLVPGDGVATAWLHALGPTRARYFLLTGQQLDAQEAFDLGIVNEIVPSDQLLDRAWELAREIVKRSPLTVRYTKMILANEWRRRMSEQLPYTLVLEAAANADAGGDLGLLVMTTGIDGTGFARKRE
jgi:enoyl-CoA hydratase/carnithine racemase